MGFVGRCDQNRIDLRVVDQGQAVRLDLANTEFRSDSGCAVAIGICDRLERAAADFVRHDACVLRAHRSCAY